jgi:hypothetical protein
VTALHLAAAGGAAHTSAASASSRTNPSSAPSTPPPSPSGCNLPCPCPAEELAGKDAVKEHAAELRRCNVGGRAAAWRAAAQ